MTFALIGLSVATGWCIVDAWRTVIAIVEFSEERREAHE